MFIGHDIDIFLDVIDHIRINFLFFSLVVEKLDLNILAPQTLHIYSYPKPLREPGGGASRSAGLVVS
jgi:hypothetical protein